MIFQFVIFVIIAAAILFFASWRLFSVIGNLIVKEIEKIKNRMER